MRANAKRELRCIAYIEGGKYKLIGFYLTGSNKEFKTVKETLKYGKSRGWKIVDPLGIRKRHE